MIPHCGNCNKTARWHFSAGRAPNRVYNYSCDEHKEDVRGRVVRDAKLFRFGKVHTYQVDLRGKIIRNLPKHQKAASL